MLTALYRYEEIRETSRLRVTIQKQVPTDVSNKKLFLMLTDALQELSTSILSNCVSAIVAPITSAIDELSVSVNSISNEVSQALVTVGQTHVKVEDMFPMIKQMHSSIMAHAPPAPPCPPPLLPRKLFAQGIPPRRTSYITRVNDVQCAANSSFSPHTPTTPIRNPSTHMGGTGQHVSPTH